MRRALRGFWWLALLSAVLVTADCGEDCDPCAPVDQGPARGVTGLWHGAMADTSGDPGELEIELLLIQSDSTVTGFCTWFFTPDEIQRAISVSYWKGDSLGLIIPTDTMETAWHLLGLQEGDSLHGIWWIGEPAGPRPQETHAWLAARQTSPALPAEAR